MRRVIAAVAGLLVGSVVGAGWAHAQPTSPTPVPSPPGSSTSEELADMVLDAIDHGADAPSAVPQP